MDRVSITAYGSLKDRLGEATTVAAGQTAAQVVESLGLGSAGGLPVTPLVNGSVVAWDYLLQPGDSLALLPTIGGGAGKLEFGISKLQIPNPQFQIQKGA